MKTKITVLCCCVLLCLSSTFSTPIGEKTETKEVEKKTGAEDGLATTVLPLIVRQEEVGGVIGQTSVAPDVVVDEDTDEDEEEGTERPKVSAAAAASNLTSTKKPPIKTSFNNEWNFVTGLQPPAPKQPQVATQPQTVPQPQTQQGVAAVVEKEVENKEVEKEEKEDAEQAQEQEKEQTKEANKDEDAENPEDEDEEEDDVKPTEKVVSVSTTVKPVSSSVAEEYAIVTGNQTALNILQESKKQVESQSKPDQLDAVATSTVSTTTVTSFKKEWALVTGNASAADTPAARTGAEGSEQAQEQEKVVSAATPTKTEEAVTTQPESQPSSNVATGTDEGEEEDEEEVAVTEKVAPVVSSTSTSTTKKPTSFEKEWAIVTDFKAAQQPLPNQPTVQKEEVAPEAPEVPTVEEQKEEQKQEGEEETPVENPNEISRGGPHLSDGGQARAGCECGKVPFKVPGDVNQWPWVAAIVRNGLFAGGRPHCGATLINNKYVLTAASCMDGILPDRIEVWLTVHDSLKNTGSSSGTLKLAVEKILMHPNYHRSNGENDIALVGLLDTVPIGENNYFVPACVPAGKLDYSGIMGKMAAWGASDVGQFNQRVNNNKLCKADMPILSNEVCNRDTRHNGRITNNMLCAGFITPKAETTCVSDAGGGLLISNGGRHTLIGVTSFGYTPNKAYSPTVHSRVSEYPDWILHNTLDAEWCS